MPAEMLATRQARVVLPSISGQTLPPILLQNPIFSPARTANDAKSAAALNPLGGAVVAGAVSIRGRSYAVIQRPDGAIVRLGIGSVYAGWRLRSLSTSGALFEQGAQKMTLNFGIAPTPVSTSSAEYEEEQ